MGMQRVASREQRVERWACGHGGEVLLFYRAMQEK